MLKKYFWVGRILVVALCAYLSANAVSIYVRGSFTTQPTLNIPTVAAPSVQYKPLNDYDPILKRSLFNSAGVNLEASFVKKDTGAGPSITAEDLQLMGVIAGGDPDDSYAIINTKHDGKTDTYRVGTKIGGETEITAIRSREVDILRAGVKSTISLPEVETAAIKKGDRWGKGTGERIAEGVRKNPDGSMVVDKEFIDNAFKDMGKMMTGARLMPNFDNGKINGFKISHIQNASLYKTIGLQDGDTLLRVNSKELNNPLDGLRAIDELRNAKNISIDIIRNSARQTLSYSVR
jgi:type II secretion system protein C